MCGKPVPLPICGVEPKCCSCGRTVPCCGGDCGGGWCCCGCAGPLPGPLAGSNGVKSPLFSFLARGSLGDFLPPIGVAILGTDVALLSFSLSSGVFGPDDLARLGCLMRLRSFIVSVFKLMGRGRPCNLRNNPHALQSTCPVSSRRHNGVVCVLQLRHTGDVMLVLVVVVPLVMWVVVLAFGCTGLAATTWGKRCVISDMSTDVSRKQAREGFGL